MRIVAPSTLLQARLREMLGFAAPSYRHHALLLEARGGTFSKFHGAVDLAELVSVYDAPGLCGLLARLVGLVPEQTRCHPSDLVGAFDWSDVSGFVARPPSVLAIPEAAPLSVPDVSSAPAPLNLPTWMP